MDEGVRCGQTEEKRASLTLKPLCPLSPCGEETGRELVASLQTDTHLLDEAEGVWKPTFSPLTPRSPCEAERHVSAFSMISKDSRVLSVDKIFSFLLKLSELELQQRLLIILCDYIYEASSWFLVSDCIYLHSRVTSRTRISDAALQHRGRTFRPPEKQHSLNGDVSGHSPWDRRLLSLLAFLVFLSLPAHRNRAKLILGLYSSLMH